MRSKARIVPLLAVTVGVLLPLTTLGDVTCSLCGFKIQADRRNPSYEQSLLQTHLANCPARNRNPGDIRQSGPRPDPNLAEVERQRRAQQEVTRQQQDELRRQQEAADEMARQVAARAKVRADAADALGKFKGGDSGRVGLQSATDPFGIKGNPTTFEMKHPPPGYSDLRFDPAERPRATYEVRTAWNQVQAASSLSEKALAAIAKSDLDEAAFLSTEAGRALNGERLAVQVGPAKPFPTLKVGGVTAAAVTQVYQLLIKSTTEEVTRMVKVQTRLPQLTARREQTQQKAKDAAGTLEKARAALEELKRMPPSPGPPPANLRQKESELADAEALLAKAVAETNGAQAALDAANGEIEKSSQNVARFNAFSHDVQRDPESAVSILQQLGVPRQNSPPK